MKSETRKNAALLFFISFLLIQCAPSHDPQPAPAPLPAPPAGEEVPGWEDVQNFLVGERSSPGKCATCHHSRGTPPTLLTLEDYQRHRARVEARAIVNEDMPPPNNSQGVEMLKNDEYETLAKWLKYGAPKDRVTTDPTDPNPTPPPPTKPKPTPQLPEDLDLAKTIPSEDDVVPTVVLPKCATCHNPGSPDRMDLTTAVKVQQNLEAIRDWVVIKEAMPPKESRPLTEREKGFLATWIFGGAPRVRLERVAPAVPRDIDLDKQVPGFADVFESILKPKCATCHGFLDNAKPEYTSYQKVTDKDGLNPMEKMILASKPGEEFHKEGLKINSLEKELLTKWISEGTPPERTGGGIDVDPSLIGIKRPVSWKVVEEKVWKPQCVSCHSPDSKWKDYSTRKLVKKDIKNIIQRTYIDQDMPRDPNDPDDLFGAIPMPAFEKGLLMLWVADGMKK